MKKAAFFFAIFYLLNVVGYGIEVHYCLGQIADINYAFLDTSCACDSAHVDKVTTSCCSEESFFVQLEDEHQAASTSFNFQVAELEVPSLLKVDVSEPKVSEPKGYVLTNAPPKPKDLVVELHSFVFYG